MNRRPLCEYELEKGIKIHMKNKEGLFSEYQFKNLIKSKYITCKTEKGLEYLESIC